MARGKGSFFERITGGVEVPEEELEQHTTPEVTHTSPEPVEEEGQLTVDVYQTAEDIVIQAFVAGVRLDNLDVAITQDTLTIRGKREQAHEVTEDDYYCTELYWGSFSRTISLPQEVDIDSAQATMKTGVLTIRLKKLNRERIQKLRVRNE